MSDTDFLHALYADQEAKYTALGNYCQYLGYLTDTRDEIRKLDDALLESNNPEDKQRINEQLIDSHEEKVFLMKKMLSFIRKMSEEEYAEMHRLEVNVTQVLPYE